MTPYEVVADSSAEPRDPSGWRTWLKVSGPHTEWVFGINRGAWYATARCLFVHCGPYSFRFGRIR